MELLPAYSPELNPAELVFSEVKSHLRDHPRNKAVDLFVEIALAFSQVPGDHLQKYY